MVDYICSHPDCDREAKDDAGRTPLFRASQYGMTRIVKLLVEKFKCNCSTKDADNATPLHPAAIGGHLEIVKFLCLQLSEIEVERKIPVAVQPFILLHKVANLT